MHESRLLTNLGLSLAVATIGGLTLLTSADPPVEQNKSAKAPAKDAATTMEDSDVMGLFETPIEHPGEQIAEIHKQELLIETWADVERRMRENPNPPSMRDDATAPFNRKGQWAVPSRGGSYYPHSGIHYLHNKYGDREMGIGFPRPVTMDSVYIAGQAGEGVWAEAVRVVGYRNGREVAATDWFADIDETPTKFDINLVNVDRIVFEAKEAFTGGAWYAIDDFAYTTSMGETVTLDFEDTTYRATLSETEYAGLDWETGAGLTGHGDAMPPPMGAPGKDNEGDDGDAGGDRGDDDGDGARGGAGTPPFQVASWESVKRGDNGQFSYPPDTCGAVGTDQFVTVVNQNFRVHNKDTGAILAQSSLQSFQPGSGGDPRVHFDQFENRWIVLSTNFSNRLYLAYSATDDATGTWYKTSFVVSTGADSGRWPDYPTLGYDEDGIYTAAYMVGGPGHSIFAIDKAPLLSGSPSLGTVTAFRSLNWEGAIQPAATYGDAGGQYFVGRRNSSSLRVRKLTGSLVSPSLSTVGNVSIPGHSDPPDAPSLGSGTPLDTVGTRLMNAVWRDDTLWCAHCISISGRAAIRWYAINTNTLVDVNGTISDNSLYYFFPAICVNAAGDAVIGFSGSNSSTYAGCYSAGRRNDDPSGQMSDPFLYKAGTGSQNNIDGAGRNRFGDYSLTSLDPEDQSSMWTIQEFGRSTNIWGTWVAQYVYDFSPPPANNDCADAITVAMDSSTAVDTTGATTGSGSENCLPGDDICHDDVWYRFTATCDGDVTISMCDADFDARIAVYFILCPSGDNEAVECDSSSCGGSAPTLTFTPNPGFSYAIRVGGSSAGDEGTGTLMVTCEEEKKVPCPGDADGNGTVNTTDLLQLLGEWGPCPGCGSDFNGDDNVGTPDLLIMLGAWGPCPV